MTRDVAGVLVWMFRFRDAVAVSIQQSWSMFRRFRGPVPGSQGMSHTPFDGAKRVVWSLLSTTALVAAVQAAPAPQEPAPDFALRGVDGANYRLSEYRGEIVMLVFWATWCGDCRTVLGDAERLWRTYRAAGLMALGVNLDERTDAAASLARAVGTTFPVVLDSTKNVSRAFDIDALPTVVLLDRTGRVRFIATGRGDDAGRLTDSVRRLLDE